MRKIARETGEDEDPNITLLSEKDIIITNEEIEFFSSRHKFLYIIELYNEFDFNKICSAMKKALFSIITEDFVSIITIKGIKYIKYPRMVENWRITTNILEDLKVVHKIKGEEFTEDEWIEIQTSEPWKKSENQVAREIIALEICEHLNIST